jgi:N terminus of Rad21 / Rec8 like protein
MFYSAQILAKKGPLGTIWIAAHHDKKYLKKQQVSGTDILESCGAPAFLAASISPVLWLVIVAVTGPFFAKRPLGIGP